MTDFLDDLARAIRALRADLAAAEARLAQSQTVSHGQAWDRITAEAENAALRARLAPIVALMWRDTVTDLIAKDHEQLLHDYDVDVDTWKHDPERGEATGGLVDAIAAAILAAGGRA
jgi:hypothetical protein